MILMNAVGAITLATLVLGPYFAIRFGRGGVLIGALVVWVVPAAVRHVLIYAGDDSYGGFGLGVHVFFGWLFGLGWCAVCRMVYLRFRPQPENEPEPTE